jgi:nucleoside phosphorylase
MRVAVLFVAALGWESRQLLRRLAVSQPTRRASATLWTASCALGEVAILQTGIGGDRADAGLRFALEHVTPEVVLSTGCAGALDPALATGDLVVADDMVDAAGERVATSSRWRERYLRAADRAGVRSMTGSMLSSAEVLLAADSKRGQAARTGAAAVEMEGMALARRAEAFGIEFAAARVILDPASVTLPVDILGVTDAHGGANPVQLMRALVRRPSLVPELVSLGAMAAKCRKALFAVHSALLPG